MLWCVSSYSAFGCPYSHLNMNKETTLADRISSLSRSDSFPGEMMVPEGATPTKDGLMLASDGMHSPGIMR